MTSLFCPFDVLDISEAGDRRCLGVGGRPLCAPKGVEQPGAMLVNHLFHVTCPVCAIITKLPMFRVQRPASA